MEKSKDRGERYISIPEQVLTDNRLSLIAKILYGEIKELCKIDKKSYCTASNRFFADRYGVSIPTVIKGLKELEKHGYIAVSTVLNYSRSIMIKKGKRV